MRFVTRLGNFSIAWVMLALVLILIPKTRKIGLAVMVAVILDSVLCNVILKNIFLRPRPCDVNTAINLLIPRPLGYSFPSGHTSASFAAVSALYFSGENRIWKAALALAILIAFSRMYLYVHYPTDVLGGIICGIICGYASWWCIRRFSPKKPG